jgi:hypothetical protein
MSDANWVHLHRVLQPVLLREGARSSVPGKNANVWSKKPRVAAWGHMSKGCYMCSGAMPTPSACAAPCTPKGQSEARTSSGRRRSSESNRWHITTAPMNLPVAKKSESCALQSGWAAHGPSEAPPRAAGEQ